MNYQEGLSSTKRWLKTASKMEILSVIEQAGLSEQKAKIIMMKYCEEKARLHISDDKDVALNEHSVSKKTTDALRRIHSCLRWLGLVD